MTSSLRSSPQSPGPGPVHPDAQRPRLPAEWEPHAALMLTWPHDHGDWGQQLDAAERCMEALAVAAARFEPLLITCRSAAHVASVRTRLQEAGVPLERMIFGEAPSNDIWVRDHGPVTVLQPSGRAQLLDFCFNGWGGRYAGELDDAVTRALTASGVFGADSYRRIQWVLEGGALDCDGRGTVLTTTRCLLNGNRNDGVTRAQVEEQLAARLGLRRFHWLEHGWLEGDDTDGHVDMLARFVDPETIAYTACDDPRDPHAASLSALADELAALRTMDGEPYRLVPLPIPEARFNAQGQRVPANYTNFSFVNGAVLLPCYGDRNDAVAAARLAQVIGEREVIQVPAQGLVVQGGSLHCATMHLPRAVTIAGYPEEFRDVAT